MKQEHEQAHRVGGKSSIDQAQHLFERFNGGAWQDSDGVSLWALLGTLEAAGDVAKIDRSQAIDGTALLKYTFLDESCIVVAGLWWSPGFAGCFCAKQAGIGESTSLGKAGHAPCNEHSLPFPSPGFQLEYPGFADAAPALPLDPAESLDYACPECGKDGSLYVEIVTFAKLSQDGTDANVSDHGWDDASPMECRSCNHPAPAKDFKLCAFCGCQSEEDHKACSEAWSLNHEASSEEDAIEFLARVESEAALADEIIEEIHEEEKEDAIS